MIALLLGCRAPAAFRGDVPEGFGAEELVAVDDDAALILGEVVGNVVILRVERDRVTTGYDQRGLAGYALAAGDGVAWAIATVDHDPHLLRSDDGGRSWSVVGPVSLELSGQLVYDDGVLWAWNRQLGRSDDGGKTWRTVAVPGERRFDEHLLIEDGVITVLGDPVRTSTDGGVTWEEPAVGVKVRRADARWWLGMDGRKAVIEPRGSSAWEELPVPEEAWPEALYERGDELVVVTGPTAATQAHGLYVLWRRGSGGWHVERRPGQLFSPTTAFGPGGRLFAYDPLRTEVDAFDLP